MGVSTNQSPCFPPAVLLITLSALEIRCLTYKSHANMHASIAICLSLLCRVHTTSVRNRSAISTASSLDPPIQKACPLYCQILLNEALNDAVDNRAAIPTASPSPDILHPSRLFRLTLDIWSLIRYRNIKSIHPTHAGSFPAPLHPSHCHTADPYTITQSYPLLTWKLASPLQDSIMSKLIPLRL